MQRICHVLRHCVEWSVTTAYVKRCIDTENVLVKWGRVEGRYKKVEFENSEGNHTTGGLYSFVTVLEVVETIGTPMLMFM